MKKILFFLIIDIFCQDINGQTINKLPVTKTDTIRCAWNYPLWLGTYGASILDNDQDPEKDSLYITSYKIGTSTTVLKPNLIYQIKDIKGRVVANYFITSEGRVVYCATVINYTGTVNFTYIVNDGHHSTGKSGKAILIIYPSADWIINRPDYIKVKP